MPAEADPPLLHAEDYRLVDAALGGDENAVELLVERLACVPAMVRARHQRLGAPFREDELADVVQDTLASIWSKLRAYGGRSTLETWAYGFGINEVFKALDRRRRNDRQVDWEDEAAPPAPRDRSRTASFEYEYVHSGLERVGPPSSDVIRLKHFQQLTFEEIGQELDISPNTAKSHYYRGLAKLKSFLEPMWKRETT